MECAWPVPGELVPDDRFWSADSRVEIGESVEFPLNVVEQAVSIGSEYCDAMARRFFDARSPRESPYRGLWAQ